MKNTKLTKINIEKGRRMGKILTGRPKGGEWDSLLRKVQPGDSFVVPAGRWSVMPEQLPGNLLRTAKMYGVQLKSRKEGQTRRVFIVSTKQQPSAPVIPQPEEPSPVESKPETEDKFAGVSVDDEPEDAQDVVEEIEQFEFRDAPEEQDESKDYVDPDKQLPSQGSVFDEL